MKECSQIIITGGESHLNTKLLEQLAKAGIRVRPVTIIGGSSRDFVGVAEMIRKANDVLMNHTVASKEEMRRHQKPFYRKFSRQKF